ncbi:MAG: hypothetical protein OXI91_08020 [Chloroflexota bacterium]|nr:hypothetical protein [Chloroflexota bacterium]
MRIGVFKRLIAGMERVEEQVSAERGPFSLFALLEREDWNEYDNYPVGHSWHLFVAAPWIWEDEMVAWKYLRELAKPYEEGWNPFERSLRIQTVKLTSPYLEEVWEYCSTENGMVEIYDVDILEVTARRGYIFASRRPDNFDEIRQAAQQKLEQERERQDRLTKEEMARFKEEMQARGIL